MIRMRLLGLKARAFKMELPVDGLIMRSGYMGFMRVHHALKVYYLRQWGSLIHRAGYGTDGSNATDTILVHVFNLIPRYNIDTQNNGLREIWR